MTEDGIIATYTIKLTLREAAGEPTVTPEKPDPTVAAVEQLVVDAARQWPWLEATASAERTDK